MVTGRPWGKPCPNPSKAHYENRLVADKALGKTWRRQGSGPRPVRSYKCRCGYWHLTHKPLYRKGDAA